MSPRKPRKTGLKFDGYTRVSRVNGRSGESFRSPVEQRETIERLALAHGLELDEFVEEMDVSGGSKIEQRELGRLVQKVMDGRSGGLVVWKVSRFSRDMVDGILTAGAIREAGGRIIGSDLDTGAPMGRALLGFLLGWAEEEREARTEDWANHQAAARARGIHITARVPFGYAKNGGGNLVQNEDAALVEEVYRRRADGETWQPLCDWLDAQGARTPMLGDGTGKTGGGNCWTEGALRKLVQNPIYKGEPRGGGAMPDDAKAALKIVSARVWEKAQPANGGRRPRSEEGAMLGGLVRCGTCGGLMTPEIVTKPSGRKIQSYRCRQRAAGAKRCKAPMTVSGNLLEPHVVEQALARLHAAGEFMVERRGDEGLDSLREAVADARHDRDEFKTAAFSSGLSPAQVAEYAAGYERALANAQAAYEEARERAAVEKEVFSESAGREAFEAASIPKQRALMHEVLRGITVKRGKEPIEKRAALDWRPFTCTSCGAMIEGTQPCGCRAEAA